MISVPQAVEKGIQQASPTESQAVLERFKEERGGSEQRLSDKVPPARRGSLYAAKAASPYLQLDPADQHNLLMKMEWELGASRERQLDLEEQLLAAQTTVRKQAIELEALRSEVTALRAKSLDNRGEECQRKVAREGLDRLINRAQATRESWERSPEPQVRQEQQSSRGFPSPCKRSQHGSGANGPIGESPSQSAWGGEPSSSAGGATFETDADFLRHLEDFKLRTDKLQAQIAHMHRSGAGSSPDL